MGGPLTRTGSMAALPALETPRLLLRPRTLADLDACVAMDREPGTLDWIDWPLGAGGWGDPEAHRAFVRARILGPYPPGMGYWVVARRESPDLDRPPVIPAQAGISGAGGDSRLRGNDASDRRSDPSGFRSGPDGFLGWVLLIPADARGPEIEIGWRLTAAARGHGYATEAAARLLNHGLHDLGLSRVVADIRPENAASLRVAEKIGMRRAGSAPGAPGLVRFEATR